MPKLEQALRAAHPSIRIRPVAAVPLFTGSDGGPISEPSTSQQEVLIDVNRIRALSEQSIIKLTQRLGDLGTLPVGPISIRDDVLTARIGQGELSVVTTSGQLYGSIRVNGRVFQIVQTDQERYSFKEQPNPNERDIVVALEKGGAFEQPECPRDNSLTAAIAYTEAVEGHERTIATTIIPGAERLLNDALARGGLGAAFKFTAVKTTDAETGNINDDLTALSDPGGLRWRSLYNRPEDLVILLVKEASASGIATLGSTPIERFAVVKVDAIAGFTLSHEIGHLSGADHEYEDSPGNSDNHGFWAANSFRTIMAVGGAWCGTCNRYNLFSQATPIKGVTVGNSTHANVTRVLGVELPKINTYSCRSREARTSRADIRPGSQAGLASSR